jgi:hypothetical protein
MREPFARPCLQIRDGLPCQSGIESAQHVIAPDCAQYFDVNYVGCCEVGIGVKTLTYEFCPSRPYDDFV